MSHTDSVLYAQPYTTDKRADQYVCFRNKRSKISLSNSSIAELDVSPMTHIPYLYFGYIVT